MPQEDLENVGQFLAFAPETSHRIMHSVVESIGGEEMRTGL